MTTIPDATGYSDQDNGQKTGAGQTRNHAPKTGASPNAADRWCSVCSNYEYYCICWLVEIGSCPELSSAAD